MTVVGWADVFTRKVCRDIVIRQFKFYSSKGLVINAYVIMSNHIHIICYARKDSKGLSAIVRDFKKRIAFECLMFIEENSAERRKDWLLLVFRYHGRYNKRNKKYQFWIQDNRPIELNNDKWVIQKLNYIHLNPVKEGIVECPTHYLYSSARNYYGQKGLVEVELNDLPLL